MKSKISTIPVLVEKLIPGGQALGTLPDGKKIFFWGALPGETVTEYQITKNKNHYAEAIMLNIIHPSPHRVKPKDEHFLATSPWQIMDYDYELQQKSELVQETFREHDIKIAKPEVITDGNPYYYRNKMEYSLYYAHEDEKIHLAFHARGSHQKIPIENSSIERPEILQRAKEIVAGLNSTHADARRYQSLLLRCNQLGEVEGGLLENNHPHPTFQNLTDTILGHEYSYSPNGFFQINLPVYELALKEIKKYIKTEDVLDLYAGVGTIGLSTARDRHLTLVESNPAAFTELAKNVLGELRNGVARGLSEITTKNDGASPVTTGASDPSRENTILSSPQAILAKSEDALDHILPDQTVIVDPPRAGLDVKLTEKLLEITPKIIIYLSCNPSTQARDVKILQNHYEITTIKTFNFFPRTPHIENLVVLARKEAL